MKTNCVPLLRFRIGPLALLWCASALAVPYAATAEAGSSEADSHRSHVAQSQLAIRSIGGPTLHLQFGPISIVTDPVFGDSFHMIDPNTGEQNAEHQRLSARPEVAEQDGQLVLLSHDHPDHFDDAAFALYRENAHFLVPSSQEASLRQRGIVQVDPLAWHQKRDIVKDGFRVSITALPAQHSERSDLNTVLGEVNAYWLEFHTEGYRRSLFWTGDSFFIPGLSVWPDKPDLFVPHVGAVGAGGPFGAVSMNAQEALKFSRLVAPKTVLPIHHSTFSLYREPISVFRAAAQGEAWDVLILEEGSSVVIE